MNRKIDKFLHDISGMVSGWSERKRNVVPHESGNPRIALTFDHSQKLSDKAMNPDLITMKQFLESGVPVDPSAFASVNNFKDVADVEEFLETQAGVTLKFAQENKEAILSAIKVISSSVSPSNTGEPV